jgi:hypothetical protein
MDKEHFLNQKFNLNRVYLFSEPNKHGGEIDLFYFCIYDKENDIFVFLNDLKAFSKHDVLELVPEDPANRINCMWYDYLTQDDPAGRHLGLEPNDGEFFYWDIVPCQDLYSIIDCDEVCGLHENAKMFLENNLCKTFPYKLHELRGFEQRFIKAQKQEMLEMERGME